MVSWTACGASLTWPEPVGLNGAGWWKVWLKLGPQNIQYKTVLIWQSILFAVPTNTHCSNSGWTTVPKSHLRLVRHQHTGPVPQHLSICTVTLLFSANRSYDRQQTVQSHLNQSQNTYHQTFKFPATINFNRQRPSKRLTLFFHRRQFCIHLHTSSLHWTEQWNHTACRLTLQSVSETNCRDKKGLLLASRHALRLY